jgi:hypothetical protein
MYYQAENNGEVHFCKTLENLGGNFSTKNRGQWWTFVEFDVMREQGEQMSL